MDRRNLYASDLQIDYFSESYSHFEEDFQRYSNMSVPLTFCLMIFFERWHYVTLTISD